MRISTRGGACGACAPPACEGGALSTVPGWWGPGEACRVSAGSAVDALALSSDGAVAFTAGGEGGLVRCFDARRPWALRPQAASHAGKGHLAGVSALVVAPDERSCFTGGRDGEARAPPLLRLAGGSPPPLSRPGAHSGTPPPCAPLLTRHAPPQLRLWSPQCALVHAVVAHAGGVTCVLRHGASHLWSAGEDGSVRRWECGDAALLTRRTLSIRAHGGRVTALAVVADGALVASGGVDKLVRLHATTAGGQLLATLRGHSGWVTRISFTPDQTQLLSGGYEGDVRLWSVQRRASLGTLRASGAFEAPEPMEQAPPPRPGCPDAMVAEVVALPLPQFLPGASPRSVRARRAPLQPLSPTGSLVVVASREGVVRLWDLAQGRCVGEQRTGDAICALTLLPARVAVAVTDAACAFVTAHRGGSLRGWSAGFAGLAATWTLPGAHDDWATALVPHAACDGAVVLSSGEDGALAAWRIAPPRAWSRAAHVAYPDAFRAAAREFLLCLCRLASQEVVLGGARARQVCSPRAQRKAPHAQRRLSPVSPPLATPPPQRGAARRSGRLRLSDAMEVDEETPAPSPQIGLGRRASADGAAPLSLRLHGATREALVDLVMSSLARISYREEPARGM